jgi:hypothetical protein
LLDDVARERRSHALRMLGHAQAEAIGALVGVLRSGDPNAVVKAAHTPLEHGMETLLVDIAQRVARLEQDAARAQ